MWQARKKTRKKNKISVYKTHKAPLSQSPIFELSPSLYSAQAYTQPKCDLPPHSHALPYPPPLPLPTPSIDRSSTKHLRFPQRKIRPRIHPSFLPENVYSYPRVGQSILYERWWEWCYLREVFLCFWLSEYGMYFLLRMFGCLVDVLGRLCVNLDWGHADEVLLRWSSSLDLLQLLKVTDSQVVQNTRFLRWEGEWLHEVQELGVYSVLE